MRYSYYQGVGDVRQYRSLYIIIAIGLSLLLTVSALIQGVGAASSPVNYNVTPFTQNEVNEWSPDRTSPTGGYESVSFGARTNVLEIRLDGEKKSEVGFHQTEGLQRDIPDSDSIKADVYVDSAWGEQTIRAGLWGVAHDSASTISAYPIIEYSTDPINQTGYEDTEAGWRYWDVNHWVSLPEVLVNSGWNTLEITHDREASTFVYRVNGAVVADMAAEDTETIAAAILNSKNYDQNYAAHWSNFAYGNVVTPVATKEACKNNGWATSFDKNGNTFKNQGQCVAFVTSSEKSKLNR